MNLSAADVTENSVVLCPTAVVRVAEGKRAAGRRCRAGGRGAAEQVKPVAEESHCAGEDTEASPDLTLAAVCVSDSCAVTLGSWM